MDTPITDDYVASILQRDAAKKGTNRFLTTGLGSLLKREPRSRDAPKPNTRFLKHIVKEADSHNAALRKREEEESRARLRRVVGAGSVKKEERRSRISSDKSRPEREYYKVRRRSRSPRREKDGMKDNERRHRRRRTRSTSLPSEEERAYRRKSRTDKREHRKERRQRSPRGDQAEANSNTSDSDPLESVIGPLPPPKIKPRGRGATHSSSIDNRFSSNYDPSTDVGRDEDSGGDDWDMAMEALRDRAKWQKSRAERLLAAGFTEEEVGKSGSQGRDREKDVTDVRWSKQGEAREWDRGKDHTLC